MKPGPILDRNDTERTRVWGERGGECCQLKRSFGLPFAHRANPKDGREERTAC